MAKSTGLSLSPELLRYNARVVVLNSYWLFVVPLVASQLVIFWYMAMSSLIAGSAVFVAQTTELVAPLFAAFLCAHVLAPEYRHRLQDLVFSRPVPFARTTLARLLTMFVFLVLLIALMLAVYKYGLKAEYNLRTVVLAGLPPVLFLSMLSLAVAAVWQSPMAGVAAAGAVWVGDVLVGAKLNPLLTLHSYAVKLADPDATDSQWLVSKVLLCLGGLVLAWIAARAVGRPSGPIRWQLVSKSAVAVGVILLCYVGSGALYKVQQLVAMEANPEAAPGVRRAHQAAFLVYGRLPVAYLFGSTYANYIGYPVLPGAAMSEVRQGRQRMADQLRYVAFKHPNSRWADNAYFELIRVASAIVAEERELKGGEGDEVIDRQTAVQYCHQFLAEYPDSPFAPYVAQRLTGLNIALNDEPEMVAAYELLLASYPGHPVATETARTMMNHYATQGRLDQAVLMAEAAQRATTSGGDPEALLAIADFLRSQGRLASARRGYEQTIAAAKAATDTLDASHRDESGAAGMEYLKARGSLRQFISRAQAGLRELPAE